MDAAGAACHSRARRPGAVRVGDQALWVRRAAAHSEVTVAAVWSHILSFMDAADEDLDASKIRANGACTQAVLAKVTEEDGKAADDSKVLRTEDIARKAQVSGLARALKFISTRTRRSSLAWTSDRLAAAFAAHSPRPWGLPPRPQGRPCQGPPLAPRLPWSRWSGKRLSRPSWACAWLRGRGCPGDLGPLDNKRPSNDKCSVTVAASANFHSTSRIWEPVAAG